MQKRNVNSSAYGWVKLPRWILGWEHFKDINVMHLYVYLLLSADKETGSVEASIRGLASMTGLSVQNVRTALKTLEREGMVKRGLTQHLTQDLTQHLTQQTGVITICDFDVYSGSESDSQHTNQHTFQHTNQHSLQKGFPPTPPFPKNKQENNNIIINNSACAKDVFVDEVHNCDLKQEMALKSLGLSPDDLQRFIAIAEDIMQEWELTGTDDWSWKHLINHARIKIRKSNETAKTNRTANRTSADTPDQWRQRIAADALSRFQSEISN